MSSGLELRRYLAWEIEENQRSVEEWKEGKKKGIGDLLLRVRLPAFCGRAIQLPPVPYFSMKSLSFLSSSGDQGPFFTFALSQHGALPMSQAPRTTKTPTLSLSLSDCLWWVPRIR